jgi:hypothetical protein
MESTSKLWLQQRWKDKLAAGFTNSGSLYGDKANALGELCCFAAQHGMLWISLGMLVSGVRGDATIRASEPPGQLARLDDAGRRGSHPESRRQLPIWDGASSARRRAHRALGRRDGEAAGRILRVKPPDGSGAGSRSRPRRVLAAVCPPVWAGAARSARAPPARSGRTAGRCDAVPLRCRTRWCSSCAAGIGDRSPSHAAGGIRRAERRAQAALEAWGGGARRALRAGCSAWHGDRAARRGGSGRGARGDHRRRCALDPTRCARRSPGGAAGLASIPARPVERSLGRRVDLSHRPRQYRCTSSATRSGSGHVQVGERHAVSDRRQAPGGPPTWRGRPAAKDAARATACRRGSWWDVWQPRGRTQPSIACWRWRARAR